MTKHAFASLITEAFDAAKTLVHQRQQTTATEFAQRVTRLSNGLDSLDKCEQKWANWPQSPTTFGQYQRAGNSALHVAYQFAKTINAAVQVAKVTAIGMPNNELNQEQLSLWLAAARTELETVTLDLSDWPPAALMRDADLIQRQIRSEFEQSGCTELGVSLADIGLAMGFSDEELTGFVKRFSKSKKITAEKLGICPNDGRCKLYRLFDILKNLHSFSPLSEAEKLRITKQLQQVQRAPAE